jgi:hypothetical protein
MFEPKTPIVIKDGEVLAWCWNGQERKGMLPVFRLKKPTKGGWRNGRTLRIPYTQNFIQMDAHRK